MPKCVFDAQLYVMEPTSTEGLEQALLARPFFPSWMAVAKQNADRFSAEFSIREAAWAQWCLEQTVMMTGANERRYPSIVLDGRFHDPRGTAPQVKPHMEIPERVTLQADPQFPARLALFGNGLAFPWWLYPEVTAVKRALFSGSGTDIESIKKVLGDGSASILAHTAAVLRLVSPCWKDINELLIASDQDLLACATESFFKTEVSAVLPEATDLDLRIDFDQRLLEKSAEHTVRRVGVWRISGYSDDDEFSFGVCTPRLTANSQFSDPIFSPPIESPASLLVRCLVLYRIAARILGLGAESAQVLLPKKAADTGGAHLKAVPAKVGAKLPEAPPAAAVHFISVFSKVEDAWAEIRGWADRTGTVLTVSEEGFSRAFNRASRFVERAEEPLREDIDMLLPIGWDKESRVVRILFARGR